MTIDVAGRYHVHTQDNLVRKKLYLRELYLPEEGLELAEMNGARQPSLGIPCTGRSKVGSKLWMNIPASKADVPKHSTVANNRCHFLYPATLDAIVLFHVAQKADTPAMKRRLSYRSSNTGQLPECAWHWKNHRQQLVGTPLLGPHRSIRIPGIPTCSRQSGAHPAPNQSLHGPTQHPPHRAST